MSDRPPKLEWLACSRLPRWPAWAVATLAVWVGLVAAVGWLSARIGQEIVLCPLKRLAHLPCPTCGTTRSGMALLHGQVGQALWYNPLVFLAGAIAVGLLLTRLIFAHRVKVNLTPRQRKAAIILLIAAVLANWAYVIRYVG